MGRLRRKTNPAFYVLRRTKLRRAEKLLHAVVRSSVASDADKLRQNILLCLSGLDEI